MAMPCQHFNVIVVAMHSTSQSVMHNSKINFYHEYTQQQLTNSRAMHSGLFIIASCTCIHDKSLAGIGMHAYGITITKIIIFKCS